MSDINLFGEEVSRNVLLREKFIEPPFSVLNSATGSWQNRKRRWIELGIKSELGRKDNLTYQSHIAKFDYYRVKNGERNSTTEQSTSIFCPALTELMYQWFCPANGKILDPFAGGSVRGIVANYLAFSYTGIELRREQVDSNLEQAKEIIPLNMPEWICGDSEKVLDNFSGEYDFIFSCPPYYNLEKYSDLEGELSAMDYKDFIRKYEAIISKSLKLLKYDRYAVFVVGDVRDSDGYYIDFIGTTKKIFMEAGARLYNEAIFLSVIGTASIRTKQFEVSKKLVKTHQNVLIFKKTL